MFDNSINLIWKQLFSQSSGNGIQNIIEEDANLPIIYHSPLGRHLNHLLFLWLNHPCAFLIDDCAQNRLTINIKEYSSSVILCAEINKWVYSCASFHPLKGTLSFFDKSLGFAFDKDKDSHQIINNYKIESFTLLSNSSEKKLQHHMWRDNKYPWLTDPRRNQLQIASWLGQEQNGVCSTTNNIVRVVLQKTVDKQTGSIFMAIELLYQVELLWSILNSFNMYHPPATEGRTSPLRITLNGRFYVSCRSYIINLVQWKVCSLIS